MPADNLDQAQDSADVGSYAEAQALALIDIARTLREIREVLTYISQYGLPR